MVPSDMYMYRNTGHIAYRRISPQGFGFNYDLITNGRTETANRVKGIMFSSSRFLAEK